MLNVSFHISWRFCPFSNFVPPIITTRSDFYSSLTWLMWKFHKYQLHTILTEYSTIWCQVCRFILLPSNFVSYIYLSSNFIRPKYWNIKVHIFWEGHKILQNLLQLFDWQYIGQIIGEDFAKLCGLLRIYELYYIANRREF